MGGIHWGQLLFQASKDGSGVLPPQRQPVAQILTRVRRADELPSGAHRLRRQPQRLVDDSEGNVMPLQSVRLVPEGLHAILQGCFMHIISLCCCGLCILTSA